MIDEGAQPQQFIHFMLNRTQRIELVSLDRAYVHACMTSPPAPAGGLGGWNVTEDVRWKGSVIGIVVNHVAGWPAPVWLWPPFVALALRIPELPSIVGLMLDLVRRRRVA